ncbi:MAG TPA: branched-chain amino acid ABC transporter permease [Anaerovoracaceae bacterium]|nr:branched-chain amino acid ABC transporter permease [Anaerovoracaceae bacterium]
MILQQLLNGIMIGSVYALTAMGATLIYGIMRILDIANAGAYVLGAYIGWYIYYSTGSLVLAFLGSMILVGLLGVALHRTLYAPILNKPRIIPMIPLVCSVGLFTMSSDLVRLIAGPGTKAYNVKFDVASYKIGDLTIVPAWILILVLTAILFVILWVILNKTKIGLAWRATAEDAEIAKAMGVNTNNAMALSYILGYGFAAAAGIMVGILYNSITPAIGDVPSYKMLAIIVLGGLGNPVGTVVAGLLIGLTETLVTALGVTFIPKDAIAFIILIIVLLIKPSGLVSKKNKM